MSKSLEPLGQKEKDEALERLCEHFANDVITLEDFERRVDLLHRSENATQLQEILSGLPVPGEAAPATVPARPETVLPSQIEPRRIVFAVWGGASRSGRWIPARNNIAIGVMGGVELDFREALLGPGVTEVYAVAVMGGIEIIVPPDVQVECDGMAIMGGFEHVESASANPDPAQPVLRIRGFATMGGVEVDVRHIGESSREAKKRRKIEAKAAKAERKRLRGG